MQPVPIQQQPPWLDAQRPRAGRYVLGPLLGQGGVGEVREAWDVVLCRTVALKVLHKMDPASLLRFMHEARIQGRLAHPNICQIFDVDSSEAAPRIAMQLVRGPTLADAAADLPVADIVKIMAQVAGAVHAAHRLKLIHRDLKPSNILLERGPEGGWTPYVCDFGLAMGLDDPTLTAPQWVQGTPAYMAPEQTRGERARVGPATDVFALGGALYFALHGQVPGGPQVVKPQGAARPARAVPGDLDLIIGRCREQDPERRYPTAAALAEELWRVHRGEPVKTRSLGWLAHAWLLLWRRAWKPALAAALAGAVLSGLAAAGWRHQSAASRRRAAWERRFVLEAAAMERDLQLERELPVHDLRPSYQRLRLRLAELARQLGTLEAAAQGPGHYALGQGRYLLGDWAGARRELEQAGALGFQGPEAELLLACTLAAEQDQADAGGDALPALDRQDAAARVESLFHQAEELEPETAGFGEIQAAYCARDYAHAAELARLELADRPWLGQAASLAALSLTALGRQGAEAGDRLLAETRYREAMAVARSGLEQARSDESLHHAYLLAGRGLAALRQDQGDFSGALPAGLGQACAQALRLDPENPQLQDDWLGLRILEAQRLAGQGHDPGPVLDAARVFLDAWARPPLDPRLRADRMRIQCLRADWALHCGEDPQPALAEALAEEDRTPPPDRGCLVGLLNLKARAEAARGRDPRPTLDQALAQVQPVLDRGAGAPRSLYAAAAQTWLIRSRWEAAHGLDPGPSLERSRTLAERARTRRPGLLAVNRPR